MVEPWLDREIDFSVQLDMTARGLPERVIHFDHALRNALVPVITIIGLQLGVVLSFSIVTETVFQWPGIGLLLVNAIQFADIPVMAAQLLLVAALFVTVNLMVDLACLAVDPRLRSGRGGLPAGGVG